MTKSLSDPKPLRFRTAYSELPRSHITVCPSQGKTKQSFKDECDINKKVQRMQQGGLLPGGAVRTPMFSDVSGVDFQEAQFLVARARQAFEALPARIRHRFDHKPEKLLDFMADKANLEEAVKLGLTPKPEEPPAPPAPPAVAPAPAPVPAK